MIANFDLDKLTGLLKDFYTLTQIRITIFDENLSEITSYPKDVAPFCQMIRSDPSGYLQCRKCDGEACRFAMKHHTPHTYHCHAGLTESITPLYLGNLIIGYLLFGHVFSYDTHENGWNEISKKIENYQVDHDRLKAACFAMPIHSEEYIRSSSHLMEAVATYLCLEKMVDPRPQELPVQIEAYIQAHFTEPIDAVTIARTFGIGKTKLYEIAKQTYGMGIAEYIRTLRIEKAKLLLGEQKLSLAAVATECGFNDYNYFITVFKRMVGVSPKKFAE